MGQNVEVQGGSSAGWDVPIVPRYREYDDVEGKSQPD